MQYYASDLSYLLDIGEIADMHVVTLDSGRQVLRIEAMPKKDDEYKTIKATPGKKSDARKKESSGRHHHRQEQRERMRDNPETLGDKLTNAAKTWFSNKDKPNFMRDAGF